MRTNTYFLMAMIFGFSGGFSTEFTGDLTIGFNLEFGNSLAYAYEPPSAEPSSSEQASLNEWSLDRIISTQGQTYRGLIKKETQQSVQMLLCRQQPGQPIHFIGTRIPKHMIASIERLSKDEREKLAEQIEQFKRRSQEDSNTKEQITLRKTLDLGIPTLRYSGDHFTLLTTTKEATAKLIAMRLEQRFEAFRYYLPPRELTGELTGDLTNASAGTPEKEAATFTEPTLEIIVWGSQEEFNEYKRKINFTFQNKAFFDQTHHRVVAFTTLDKVLEELNKSVREHETQLAEIEKDKLVLKEDIKRESQLLAPQGVSRSERLQNTRLRMAFFTKKEEELTRKIEALNRQNENNAKEFTDQNLRILYHEAFHGYLDTFVYPHREYSVPRWLNEGLAQAFEGAMLELGKVRFESPDWKDLARRLDFDLKSQRNISLEQILVASPKEFLGIHGTNSKEAERYYLYAWGLAEFVRAKILKQLDAKEKYQKLDEYVELSADINLIKRFEALLDQPLSKLEPEWKAYIRQQASQ